MTCEKNKSVREIIQNVSGRSYTAPRVQYDDAYCQMLVKHMASGYSFSSFAKKIGTTPSNLKKWRAIYEDFDLSAQQGEAESLHFWETILIGAATGNVKGHNGKLIELVMKCRFLWSEKQHIELTGALETQLRQMTDQQIEMELRKLQARQNDMLAASGDVNTDEQIAAALEKLK